MSRKFLLAAVTTAVLAVGAFVAVRLTGGAPVVSTTLAGQQVVLYKSPTCGCCTLYADALKAAGAVVRLVDGDAALASAKRKYGIPAGAESCHTFQIGGYVIEGHVPLQALERLLAERPDIDGLVLPGMPIGTPGMPGQQTAPFEVQALEDGQLRPYMSL